MRWQSETFSQANGGITLASLLKQLLCIRIFQNGEGYKYILDWHTFVEIGLYFVIIFEKGALKYETYLSEKLAFVS